MSEYLPFNVKTIFFLVYCTSLPGTMSNSGPTFSTNGPCESAQAT